MASKLHTARTPSNARRKRRASTVTTRPGSTAPCLSPSDTRRRHQHASFLPAQEQEEEVHVLLLCILRLLFFLWEKSCVSPRGSTLRNNNKRLVGWYYFCVAAGLRFVLVDSNRPRPEQEKKPCRRTMVAVPQTSPRGTSPRRGYLLWPGEGVRSPTASSPGVTMRRGEGRGGARAQYTYMTRRRAGVVLRRSGPRLRQEEKQSMSPCLSVTTMMATGVCVRTGPQDQQHAKRVQSAQ